MELKQIGAKGESCNFCQSEKLIKHYQSVLRVTTDYLSIRICSDCLNELKTFEFEKKLDKLLDSY